MTEERCACGPCRAVDAIAVTIMNRFLLLLPLAIPCAAMAQHVPVMPVAKAGTEVHANPLKLDADRHKAWKGTAGNASPPTPHNRCDGGR